jgi:glycerophosphoryl diester phosphodiesterase
VKAIRLLHLVGYRGNSAEFPENTLPALRSAIALGVRFIELDVHLSADGVPMVCDEHQLARVTGDDDADTTISGAQMSALDVSQTNRFGERFLGTLIPTLTTALRLLEGRPEITVFVVLGRASVARFGHDQVISQVVRALKPFRSRCVLVSKDLATIHTARTRAEYPIGWMIPAYDSHTRLKYEAFKPEYLFCERVLLPASGPLWRGPWRWAVSGVSDLNTALELANRGADFVVTRDVRSLGEAMRTHAAARAAHTASMATANAVSRAEGISRADVVPLGTRENSESVIRADVSQRVNPAVRADTAPRANPIARSDAATRTNFTLRVDTTPSSSPPPVRVNAAARANPPTVRLDTVPRAGADADSDTYTYTYSDTDDERHRITMAVEA